MMLFQAQLASPTTSPYRQHQFLAATVLQPHQERDYIWCEEDGILYVRRTVPTQNLHWCPVIIPQCNNTIGLRVMARVRPMAKRSVHGNRPSTIDPVENLAWLERVAHYSGLTIIDADVEIDDRLIERPRRDEIFYITLSKFIAVATVRIPYRFERALTFGIGDAKAFGLGYIHFWLRGDNNA